MKYVLTISYGELALKGDNRIAFENRLIKTVKGNLKKFDIFEIYKDYGKDVAFGPVAHGVPAEEAHARAREVLESLNVGHLAERPPHRLSGGEKRMAALAGILVMRPEIVVLDEPSAALDPRARRRVIEVLRELDKPIILATHDLDMGVEVDVILFVGGIGDVDLRRGHVEVPDYLLNLALRDPASEPRVRMDSCGYRERRTRSLERLAEATARQVAEYGRPVRLDPMLSWEHWIIHTTL